MRNSAFAAIICLLLCCPVLARAATPTGDPLYDRFSELALSGTRYISLDLNPLPGPNPAVLPDAVLATLEAEFSKDARFWELRAWSAAARSNVETPASADTDSQSSQLEFLRRASGCSNCSIGALYKLANLEGRQRQREIDQITQSEVKAQAGSWEALRPKLIALNVADEQAMAAELDAIIAAHPDEAWPYYWKANYWLMFGEQELGCALLEQGNAAANCSYPALFPESFVRQRIWSGQPLGEKVLAGGIFLESTQLFDNAMRWKERGKEIQLCLRLGGDTALANAFQRFACRAGSSDGLLLGDSLVLLVLANMLSGGILSDGAQDLSQEQLLVLLRARDKHSEARNVLGRFSATISALNGSPEFETPGDSGTGGWAEDGPAPSTLASLQPTAEGRPQKAKYEALADEMLMQQRMLKEKVFPLMQELSLVDYSSLAWPEAWGQPE